MEPLEATRLEPLGIIAGKGAYPRILAQSARAQGIPKLFAVAFRKETEPVIETLVDEVRWVHLGQLGPFLDAFRQSGVRQAVMAGQITPTHLFRVRMDKAMLALLSALPERNAETIFGAIGTELSRIGIELKPASLFMESAMPAPGVIGRRAPTDAERADIDLGLRIAKVTSGLDVGQTVVVKNGTILAVEAFEGTDAAIRRGGELGGEGAVVVKVAKQGHDMRFDIPVVGENTLRVLRKAKAAVLAVEAGRTILLDREALAAEADRQGLCLVAVEAGRMPSADGMKNAE
jgi:UDP-2,3-diacylglucosamine hydrolase